MVYNIDMKRIIFAFLLFVAGISCLSADKVYKLDNGLKLFVEENHSVPLTYIEIAVKCGSYTQTEETAGLFHLYEHMMFKGNSLYKDASSVNRALSDMGVSEWNGTTGLECVNYFFTVPKDMTKAGLEFWNAVIRFPLLDKKEFENEKKVVLSEINGQAGEPEDIYMKKRSTLLFSDAPYTMSPSGTDECVKNATIKQLKEIQKKYYVPNNSAVFVGGDVNADEVYQMVKEIFGSWKKAKDPFASGMVRHSKTPFSEPKLCVMPYDKMSDSLANIIVDFRGPDAAYEREDTYAIDILLNVIANPEGTFKKTLLADTMNGIPDTGCAGGSYQTRRTCGTISFYEKIVQPDKDIPERALYFAENIYGVLEKTISETDDSVLEKVIRRLDDDNIIATQTASGYLSTLRFWWTTCDEEYYYGYNENMKKVGKSELLVLINKYIREKNPLITVLVSPGVYEKTKEEYAKAGFEEIKK